MNVYEAGVVVNVGQVREKGVRAEGEYEDADREEDGCAHYNNKILVIFYLVSNKFAFERECHMSGIDIN